MTDASKPDLPPGMAFVSGLSIILKIELSEPAEPISPKLLNLKAPPTATIASVSSSAGVFEDKEIRDLTEAELSRVALDEPTMAIVGLTGQRVDHTAPDGKAFTVRDVIRAIEQTEFQTRGNSEWFDGIDVHHVFFEGFDHHDGEWKTWWGS